MSKPILRRIVVQKNYTDPTGPLFAGHYAPANPQPDDALTIVSYNIDFGAKVAEATIILKTHDPLHRADIVLLQEMDEDGVQAIAQALNWNYIYYPSSIHKHGRNFGNAILSRWPITDPQKIILPYKHPTTRQIRIAARATVHFASIPLTTYSIHTETYGTRVHLRQGQIDGIVHSIPPADPYVIVGGDFNTVTRRSIRRMVHQFDMAGLQRASQGIGPTVAKFNITPSAADHIFTRGLQVIARGAVPSAGASDHFPIWVETTLPPPHKFRPPITGHR
jgi:endonuclease/exonuclease/phosphatase family metal-dependent hydrolase